MLILQLWRSFATTLDQEGAKLLQTSSSLLAAVFNGILLLLAWIFLPLENLHWRSLRKNFANFYTNVDPETGRPLDGLRILIQSLFLTLFRRPPIRRRVQRGTRRTAFANLRRRLRTRLKVMDARRTSAVHAAQCSSTFSPLRVLGIVLLGLVAFALFMLCVTQPLDPLYQGLFSIGTILLAFLFRTIRLRVTVILIILLSLLVSSRYLWWRYNETLNFDSSVGFVFSTLLLLAETYTFVLMVLSYFQSFWVLNREPLPLPKDRSVWPHVDVFIPTYNEPLELVRTTVFGALAIDWPKDKLHVWILDDGEREEFRAFAEEAGTGYVRRQEHKHAKAGNLNHALTRTSGEFVVIFDCDHIPVRSFLTQTMGWLLQDPKIAMVQTPHPFYSPAPNERNLRVTDAVPQEDALFHTFIQKGNDTWNAVLFCGSCTVIRRKALDDIGGIAVETVTEDAHTSLKLYRRGWRSAFLSTPLAAGLSTDTLASYIGQRIRWARGMIQIFRLDNPLFGPGLTWGQRLCYLSAMIYFLLGLPRLVFLIAPLPFVFFDVNVIQASGAAILVFVLPHLLHSLLTNDFVQRGFRYPLTGEIYDTVLSYYVAIPAFIALFAPHLGTFNVTSKAGRVDSNHLDWHIARPYLVLFVLNLLGLFWLIGRALLSNLTDALTLMVNAVWLTYNLTILSCAVAVAVETIQERRFHRVRWSMPAALRRRNGTVWQAALDDFSQSGVSVTLPTDTPHDFRPGETVSLLLEDEGVLHEFTAQVRRAGQKKLGLEMIWKSLDDERTFIATTFCQERLWAQRMRKPSVPLGVAVRSIISYALHGIRSLHSYAPAPVALVIVTLRDLALWVISFFPRFPKAGAPTTGRRS